MIVSLIVAMDEKRGIGKNNRLPWHLPSDLKRFKQLTMGHHLVMGRKTYETIGRPLKGRVMVVITRKKDYSPPDCTVVNSLSEALKIAEAKHESEVFVIGGGDVFRQAIDLADRIYLTTVHADTHADIRFPEIDHTLWKVDHSEASRQDSGDEYRSDFTILSRRGRKPLSSNQLSHV